VFQTNMFAEKNTLTLNLVAFVILVLSCFRSQPAAAAIAFSWHANPTQDEIVGYRLYYGRQSRTVTDGYEQYIDFGSMRRCPADGNDLLCAPLDEHAVTCQDLYRSEPQCIVHDLTGPLYFAITAYNASDESEYSLELTNVSAVPVPKALILQRIYSILLFDF